MATEHGDDLALVGIGLGCVLVAGLALWLRGFAAGLIVGLWIGAGAGVVIAGLMHAASHRDDDEHR